MAECFKDCRHKRRGLRPRHCTSSSRTCRCALTTPGVFVIVTIPGILFYPGVVHLCIISRVPIPDAAVGFSMKFVEVESLAPRATTDQ